MDNYKLKKILKIIAKRENIRAAEVRREMQKAINEAYLKPNSYAKRIPSKGDIPTVEEFLDYSAQRVKLLEK